MNWVLFFVRQCPLFGGQGRQRTTKKVPQNIDFVGLVFLWYLKIALFIDKYQATSYSVSESSDVQSLCSI